MKIWKKLIEAGDDADTALGEDLEEDDDGDDDSVQSDVLVVPDDNNYPQDVKCNKKRSYELISNNKCDRSESYDIQQKMKKRTDQKNTFSRWKNRTDR